MGIGIPEPDPLDYYAQLESLWTLADKYRVPALQRQSTEMAVWLLRALRQEFGFDVLGYWTWLYQTNPQQSTARRFIAGQIAYLLLSGQEQWLDPECIHPALRGDVVNVIHNLYPQLYC